MRGTRLAGVSPSPTAPAGSHLSRHRDAWRPGSRGSAGPRPHGSAGRGSLLSPAPRGREDRAPAPRTSFHPAACGPAAGHTCQLERLQPGPPRQVSGGREAACALG